MRSFRRPGGSGTPLAPSDAAHLHKLDPINRFMVSWTDWTWHSAPGAGIVDHVTEYRDGRPVFSFQIGGDVMVINGS